MLINLSKLLSGDLPSITEQVTVEMENFLNSLVENPITFLKILSLKVFPSLAATLEDNSIMNTAVTIITNATPNIWNPAFIM